MRGRGECVGEWWVRSSLGAAHVLLPGGKRTKLRPTTPVAPQNSVGLGWCQTPLMPQPRFQREEGEADKLKVVLQEVATENQP
jgi:hypothetical protein